MTLAFVPPPCPDSLLRRFDPRWKLAALSLAILLAATLQTIPAAILALVCAVTLVLLARAPLGWYGQRVATASLVLALFALPLPFLVHDDSPVLDLGPVQASAHGARVALVLFLKGLTLLTLALVLLVSAPLDATLKAAHALRVPGALIQVMLLSYRYLFVLADEMGRLRIALRLRGYRNRANRHSYRTVGHVTGTLLVRGVERAERISQAMRCRGFDGRFRSLQAFHTTWADLLIFFLILTGTVGIGWLDRAPW
jgi:cobalt/nickel transport system permease protein